MPRGAIGAGALRRRSHCGCRESTIDRSMGPAEKVPSENIEWLRQIKSDISTDYVDLHFKNVRETSRDINTAAKERQQASPAALGA